MGTFYDDIPLRLIDVGENVRDVSQDTDAHDLKASIHAHGLLQPLVLAPASRHRYRLVAGSRRYRALLELGRAEAPCVILSRLRADISDLPVLQLAENIHRRQLTPWEIVAACERIRDAYDHHLTYDELADILHRRATWIRLQYAACREWTRLKEAGVPLSELEQLSTGHLKQLERLRDGKAKRRLVHRIVTTGMTTRKTYEATKAAKAEVAARFPSQDWSHGGRFTMAVSPGGRGVFLEFRTHAEARDVMQQLHELGGRFVGKRRPGLYHDEHSDVAPQRAG